MLELPKFKAHLFVKILIIIFEMIRQDGPHFITRKSTICLTVYFFRMASVVNKELLKTIGKMYKGMPKENWSAYHRMQFLFE